MNYDDMSDFEINKLVAMSESLIINDDQCMSKRLTGREIRVNDIVNSWWFDPCNNPSDAWPIILPTGMDIELAHKDLGGIGTCTIYNPMGTDWQCDFEDNQKALRAAMICFLKMKESGNG